MADPQKINGQTTSYVNRTTSALPKAANQGAPDKSKAALFTVLPESRRAKSKGFQLSQARLGAVPMLDATNASIIFAQLRSKLQNEVITATEQDINLNMKRMKQNNKAIMEKLNKIAADKEKAAKRGLLGKIFGWIGNILGLVVGVVAAVFTGGAGVAMIVASVIGITTSILSETGAMQKWVSAMTDAFAKMMIADGMSEDKAKKIAGVLSQVVVAVAVVAVTITAAIVSGGAALKQAATAIKDIIIRNAIRFGNAATAVAGVGAGSSQVAQGVSQYELLKATGEKIDIESTVKYLQFVISSDLNLIENLSNTMNSINNKVSDVLTSQLESRAQLTKSLV